MRVHKQLEKISNSFDSCTARLPSHLDPSPNPIPIGPQNFLIRPHHHDALPLTFPSSFPTVSPRSFIFPCAASSSFATTCDAWTSSPDGGAPSASWRRGERLVPGDRVAVFDRFGRKGLGVEGLLERN